ncbi:hypothetical protein JCM10207_000475 [Rhodosporidiobolus poonsookiae]
MATIAGTLTIEEPHAAAAPAFATLTSKQNSRLSDDERIAPAHVVTDDSAARKREWRHGVAREFACALSLAVAGWADAASGPLIPNMQEYYSITYTIAAMLFVGACIGCLCASFLQHYLNGPLGLGKLITLGSLAQTFAYALLIPGFPFPLFPVLFGVASAGVSIQDAQAQVYVAGLPNAERRLSILHAIYGLGAAVCPLAATAFVSTGRQFSHFYAISLGLSVLNIVMLLYAFRFNYRVDVSEPIKDTAPPTPTSPTSPTRTVENLELRDFDRAPASEADKGSMASQAEEGRMPSPELRTDLPAKAGEKKVSWRDNSLVLVLANRATLFCCLFIFLYVGSEVSMGGWIVTYLIDNRNGGSKAGYVATAYWGGIVVGRIALIPVTAWLGEQNAVLIYTAVALALEFVIWYAKSLVGNAIAVALVGIAMGPSFPVRSLVLLFNPPRLFRTALPQIAVSVITKLIPRKRHASTIAFLAAFGQVGAAIFPFITGALAQKFSPVALQPVMVVLLGCQIISWAGIPRISRKKE